VDTRVKEGPEPCLAASYEARAPPGQEWKGAVVDDMQGGDLVELLAKNKEYCVEKVNEFREEIPPTKAENTSGIRAIGIIHWLTVPAVLASHKEVPALLEHPEAEECLEEVVDNHDASDLIRLSVLHELRTSNLYYVDIGNADECSGPDRRHEKPVVHSWVPQVHHEVVV